MKMAALLCKRFATCVLCIHIFAVPLEGIAILFLLDLHPLFCLPCAACRAASPCLPSRRIFKIVTPGVREHTVALAASSTTQVAASFFTTLWLLTPCVNIFNLSNGHKQRFTRLQWRRWRRCCSSKWNHNARWWRHFKRWQKSNPNRNSCNTLASQKCSKNCG